jgi:ribosomal-protein-alanine N-acetyltransferase
MLQLKFHPFPVLETNRLRLRQLTLDDAPVYHQMRSDKEMMRYIPRPLSKSVADTIELINNTNNLLKEATSITWAMELKVTQTMIGTIGFYRIQKENYRGEIGYMLDKKHQGAGLMHEAIKHTIDYGFNELKFHSIEAVIDPENSASEKLLLKNNFVKEAHLK